MYKTATCRHVAQRSCILTPDYFDKCEYLLQADQSVCANGG
jgi:hypothetical protein